MGFYAEQVVPRLVDLTCGTSGMDRWRARAVEGLHGDVVEVGFGSGLNLPLYPDTVSRVYAVEPSTVARARSDRRQHGSTPTVEHVGTDGQSLPLPDDSCDGALSTFTLCTIPDVEAALAELRRVVRPGGRFNFLEHGRSPDEGVRRWQHRIDPFQQRLAGGCHLTRDIPELVRSAGFTVERITSRYVKGPKPWMWFTVGSAVNPE